MAHIPTVRVAKIKKYLDNGYRRRRARRRLPSEPDGYQPYQPFYTASWSRLRSSLLHRRWAYRD